MTKIDCKYATPKMTPEQAKIFWNSLSWEQKKEFNKLLNKLNKGDLMLSKVLTDDNEQIQRIILDEKNKPSQPIAPFMGKFKDK